LEEVRELMRRNGGLSGSVLASALPPPAESDELVKKLHDFGIVLGSRAPADAALDVVRRAAEISAQGPVFVSKLSSES